MSLPRTPEEMVLVSLGGPGQSLTVRLTGLAAPGAVVESHRGWQRAIIEVDAAPFSGVIDTVLTPDDVDQYRSALATLDAKGRAELGGDRAPSIQLSRDGSVIEVTVQPVSDDPWPYIRYLISTE